MNWFIFGINDRKSNRIKITEGCIEDCDGREMLTWQIPANSIMHYSICPPSNLCKSKKCLCLRDERKCCFQRKNSELSSARLLGFDLLSVVEDQKRIIKNNMFTHLGLNLKLMRGCSTGTLLLDPLVLLVIFCQRETSFLYGGGFLGPTKTSSDDEQHLSVFQLKKYI